MTAADPPEGFERHFRKSPLTEPWEPLSSRRTQDGVTLALRAGEAHCNGRGFVHGGLIASLVDNAMGLSCAEVLGEGHSLVTASLTVNYLGSAQRGQWVTFASPSRKLGGTLCFTEGLVLADGAPCATASGVFRRVTAEPRSKAA